MAGNAPTDITVDFIDRLIANGKTGEMVATAEWGAGFAIPQADKVVAAGRWAWFYQKVRNGGDWDFKNNVYKPYKATGVMICGQQYGNDMPGNFHFGYAGAAAGFSAGVLLKGAGMAQQRAGTSKPEFWCTFGDDPADHEFIRLGIELYRQVGTSVTQAALKQILATFQPKVCPTP